MYIEHWMVIKVEMISMQIWGRTPSAMLGDVSALGLPRVPYRSPHSASVNKPRKHTGSSSLTYVELPPWSVCGCLPRVKRRLHLPRKGSCSGIYSICCFLLGTMIIEDWLLHGALATGTYAHRLCSTRLSDSVSKTWKNALQSFWSTAR